MRHGPNCRGPFRAEMLSVWLTRAFTVDIAEHLAQARGGKKAVRLDPRSKRRLGVGNATGLGMAPFLIKHPTSAEQLDDGAGRGFVAGAGAAEGEALLP